MFFQKITKYIVFPVEENTARKKQWNEDADAESFDFTYILARVATRLS